MVDFQFFIHLINASLGSFVFIFCAEIASLLMKSYIFLSLLVNSLKTKRAPWLVKILLLVIVGAMLSNVAWVLRILKNNFFPNIDIRLYIFIVRMAWAFAVIQYQSFGLFLENIVEPKPKIKPSHIPFLITSTFLVLVFLYFAIFNFNLCHISEMISPGVLCCQNNSYIFNFLNGCGCNKVSNKTSFWKFASYSRTPG